MVYRYAYLVRQRRGADCAELFASDAVYEIREISPLSSGEFRLRNRLTGAGEIGDFVARSAGGAVRIFPIIHNLTVEIDGDRAVGDCLMTSRSFPGGGEVFGSYQDSFVRRTGRWLFSSRIYTIYSAPWIEEAVR
ncbi:MAG: nuclear transport factor 2 family protein [Novosphingobium sp.]